MKRLFMTLLALFAVAGPLLAHGKGRLKLGSQRLTPGGTVELTGSEFAKSESFAILLVGAAGRTRLGEVRSNDSGRFTITVTLPATLEPGSYRIAMEASDKDLVATADVQVTETHMAAGHAHAEGTDDHAHADATPSTEPLALDRARTPVVMGGAVATIVIALIAGGVLLRRGEA
jgi:hypothetical protein